MSSRLKSSTLRPRQSQGRQRIRNQEAVAADLPRAIPVEACPVIHHNPDLVLLEGRPATHHHPLVPQGDHLRHLDLVKPRRVPVIAILTRQSVRISVEFQTAQRALRRGRARRALLLLHRELHPDA
jgi:hypothetical protein